MPLLVKDHSLRPDSNSSSKQQQIYHRTHLLLLFLCSSCRSNVCHLLSLKNGVFRILEPKNRVLSFQFPLVTNTFMKVSPEFRLWPTKGIRAQLVTETIKQHATFFRTIALRSVCWYMCETDWMFIKDKLIFRSTGEK